MARLEHSIVSLNFLTKKEICLMYAIYNDLIDWSVFDLQEAEQQFLEALKLSPNSAEIHGNLGKNFILSDAC